MTTRAPSIVGAVAAIAILAGCTASPALAPTPAATYGSLGAGFYDPASPPAPEGTLTPPAGSWDAAHPPAGYRVVLVAYGTDAPTQTLVHAVDGWAAAEKVRLTTIAPASPSTLLASLTKAIDAKPDLIITAGDAMVDPVASLSPAALSQQFLVVGGELAEPTSNVTAADWTGAGFRGEGLGTASHYDPTTFTDERAGRAVRAGVAAVVNRVTGFVVWVS